MGSKEKKRYKKSTQSRKKKRDRDSKKRNANKLRRDEYSYSESDDESMSLVSLSSYSSEEDVKGRRSRSHAKKGVKGRKKRSSSSSCSSDSSIDSMQVKKRMSSKRKVSLVRKKKYGNKYKQAVSLNSTSREESDYEKSKKEAKKKGKRERYDKADKSMRKKKRSKARSISPSSESSASDNERKSKRKRYQSPSRSLLIKSSESERDVKRKRYWSPSGSSLSKGSESSDQLSQAEIEVQNKPIKKLNSVIVVANTVESGEIALNEGPNNDLQMMDEERTMKSSIVQKGENVEEVKSAAEATIVPANEDLESILRRKALENLKRFRGPKTSEKSEQTGKMEMIITGVKQQPNSENAADKENTGNSSMKHSLSLEILPIQYETLSDVLPSPYVYNKTTSSKNNVETRTEASNFSERTDDNRKMIPIAENRNPTITVKKSIIGDASISKQKPGKSSNVKAESNSLHIGPKPLAVCSASKSSESQVDEVNPKSDNNITNERNNISACVSDNPSSSPPTIMAADLVSSDQQIENKEESQLQEKTMSVMRGGELVQVSYKVYIPKKAPAANRRRLKR